MEKFKLLTFFLLNEKKGKLLRVLKKSATFVRIKRTNLELTSNERIEGKIS